jgi:hypothetical protein
LLPTNQNGTSGVAEKKLRTNEADTVLDPGMLVWSGNDVGFGIRLRPIGA